MKILAIRLKNLASLAGPFEIDFTAEPLASAGLFAITGPTGAGKSQLAKRVFELKKLKHQIGRASCRERV